RSYCDRWRSQMCTPCQQVSFVLQLELWMSRLFFSANDTLILPAKVLKVLSLNTSESVHELENLSGVHESGTPVHAVFAWRKSEPLVMSQSGELMPSEFQCAYSFVISPSAPVKASWNNRFPLIVKLHSRAEPVALSTISP